MAIDLATGFNIGSKDAIDERQVLTLEQMKNLDESIYPDKYFAICKDNGKLYLYDASNEINDETGKFRVLEGSGTSDLTGYKKTYTSTSELFVDSYPTSIKDIIEKLEHGETFLGNASEYDYSWFPIRISAMFRIIKGKKENLSDTTVEWFSSRTGDYAIAVLSQSAGVERWVLIREDGKWDYIDSYPIRKWNLLAKISLSSSDITKHILSFSCLNQVSGTSDGYYYFGKDADLCKYELHFTTPGSSGNLTKYGLVLYEYPMPEGTADGLKNLSKNIGLYYDEDNLHIYIFIINTTDVNYLEGRYIGNGLANCILEYTGEGTIVQSYNRSGSDLITWDDVYGNVCAFEDLEFPTVVPIGGDGGTVDLSGYAKTYTSLADLELTSSATINEVISKLSPGDVFTCSVTSFSSYQTMFPYLDSSYSNAFVFIHRGRTPVMSYAKWYKSDGSSEALAQFNALTGYIGGWNTVSMRKSYVSLSQLKLTADATITQVVNAMLEGERFRSIVTRFNNYQTMFPYEEEEDQNAYVLIDKINGNAVYAAWYRIDGTKHYIGHYINNALQNWVNYSPTSDLSEGTKTYTSLTELGLTADATIDDVIGALKDGETAIITTNEFTNYLTMFPNYCNNGQYAILKVEKKNGNRCFIEWRQKDGNAYAIGGLNSNNVFTNWNNLVRFKKDGFADDSIVCIGDTVSSDGVIQTLENLGFSNDILTWDTGVYRVSHVSGLINLPSEITSTAPAFRLEHHDCKKWGANHNPNTNTWAIRHSVLYVEGGNVYHRYYESGDTAGVYINDTGWQQIHTKKEDDSYIPDMYDRNANGDMPVVGFDRLAYSMCLIQNTNLLNNGDVYDEDYVGGWVYTMANDILIKDKEMFNKIKVVVSIPGVLRIGIVNDKIFEANPRYSTCLVKWLVADFVAFTGLKEYDIDDTILEEGQYVFIECRQGESSWYYNQGSTEVTQGKVTYPAGSCTSGLNVADTLDSTTNNVVFKSQSVTSKSAIFTFSGEINVGNKLRTNFLARGYDNTARTDMSDVKSYNQSLYKGGLNIGLYRRTKYSDTRFCKCIENGMNASWVGDDNVTKIYATYGQEELVGKSVYAFKLDVRTPGNLTIYHLKGKSLDTIQVIDKYTHYVRAKGLQTIHLPFDIKINSTDEYIGFGGLHCKSTSSNIVRHSCLWHYMAGEQVTGSCGWMNTFGKVGFYSIGVSMTSYPETFTSFEVNGSYLNIELICRGEKKSPLEDKYISFTGDSITTFAGFCTKQADVPTGNTAGDNAVYYPASGRTVNNVDATWWGILAKDNRMQILRNDAWSGSRVSSTTGSTDTKCLCGTERYKFLENSSQGTNVTFPFGEPEIIVNMIGTNDLSGNVELGEGILYGLTSPTEDDYKKLYSAYSLMCQRFASYYNRQRGKVVHFIIPRGTGLNTYANSNGDSIQKIALEFEKIAKSWGHYFIPLSYFTGLNMTNYKALTCPTSNVLRDFRSSYFNGSDGLHPNVIGMETIADGVHRFLCSIM